MRHRVLHPEGKTMGVGFDANGQRKGESGTQVEAGQEDNEKALCMPLAALLVAVIWVMFSREVQVLKKLMCFLGLRRHNPMCC